MSEIKMICSILLMLLSVMYLYTGIYVIVGFFTTRKFPKAKKNHRYGIVIAARNESAVIGDLLASIRAQSYPGEQIATFVVADNCTDNTAEIARSCGAVCYERFHPSKKTKGYALQYLFEQIRRDYGIEAFEGYLILDADNLLKPDYIEQMNKAFDSGEKIIASYRNTRNLGDGCIAASYALHWMRTVRLEHRARSFFGLATRLQGTGILFSSELVRDGWHYTQLTEDRAFCADAVARGYSISYQDEAEFFDEQPTSLRIAMRQRIRWSKGHLQAFSQYSPQLFLHMFTARSLKLRFMSYDMLLITLPRVLIRFGLNATGTLMSLLLLFQAPGQPLTEGTWMRTAALSFLTSLLIQYLWQTCTAGYVLLMERKRLEPMSRKRMVWYAMTFFLFDSIGSLSYFIAAVSKVEWKPIPHHGSVKKREQKPSVMVSPD
ncbi:MAG: glycosyltransferase family 2 protein [Lachnospiraceae bacterium]|nr:glycosyltransferase family 2 protein [Lachnospiraceae bacterium]